ncbi:MAG: hypothetical protein HRU07_03930 [Nitrosopumilus sp.]|nr:hypothetical protein [Nitrosopumilus sp.]NRA05304.1 hypothetical protein [Nitrosopumilus sp.]
MARKKEPYKTQKETKERNEHKILTALSMGSMKNSEIKRVSGLSDAGLSSVLTRMRKDGKIAKSGTGKNTSYHSKTAGTAKQIWYLGHVLSDLRENDCKYRIDYSDNHLSEAFGYGSSWGIVSHLFLAKEIKRLNLFSKKDIFQYERDIYESILSKINKKEISFDQTKKGKIVLAFEIDYERLTESIVAHKDINHKKLVNARLKELKK